MNTANPSDIFRLLQTKVFLLLGLAMKMSTEFYRNLLYCVFHTVYICGYCVCVCVCVYMPGLRDGIYLEIDRFTNESCESSL